MKTIWSLIVIVLFGFLTFQGLNLVMNEAFKNGNLDETSINLIGVYDSDVIALQNSLDSKATVLELESQGDASSNDLAAEYREYAEAKNTLTTLKDGILLIYNFPTMVLSSVPFVDYEDLIVYSNIINLLLYIMVIIAIFAALFRKEVSK